RLEISGKQANADFWSLRLVATADVSMRGAELGDHLADDVIQIAAMSDPGQQGFVAVADLLPVVASHGGIPVEITLDAPGFVEDLLPFFARIDLRLQAAQIQFALADFLAGRGFDDAVDWAG